MNNITKENNTLLPTGYIQWRKDIEQLIDTAKLKTAISVNMGTLSLYWNIGKSILQKQEQEGWGKQVIEQLSKDLISRYPNDSGYSKRNLGYMKSFAMQYPDFPFLQVTLAKLESEDKEFVQVPLVQISWYHHISLLSKVKDEAQRAYYITEAVDDIVKSPEDKPTIGLLLCRTKSNKKAEFSLRGITQPMGIAQYETEKLFADVASALPQIEEIEKSMEDLEK